MEEIKNISEMADLQKLIAEKTKNNIETGISEIKNSLEALQDMQDIIAVLVKECDNRQNQIELLKKDKENLEENIEIQKEKIRNFEVDEERYKQFKDGAVNVANVLNNLQKDKEELEHDKQKLAGDRNEFERVKNDFEEEEKQLREETKNAKEKAEKLKKECDEKSRKIDELTVEKQDLEVSKLAKEKELNEQIKANDKYIEEKEQEFKGQISQIESEWNDKLDKKENEISKLRDAISEIEEDKEWFKNYAIGQDEKIFKYFNEHKEYELKNHYDTYLNNSDKAKERMEIFGEEGVFIKNIDKKQIDEKKEKSGKKKENDGVNEQKSELLKQNKNNLQLRSQLELDDDESKPNPDEL